jgi:hypothetical protein
LKVGDIDSDFQNLGASEWLISSQYHRFQENAVNFLMYFQGLHLPFYLHTFLLVLPTDIVSSICSSQFAELVGINEPLSSRHMNHVFDSEASIRTLTWSNDFENGNLIISKT